MNQTLGVYLSIPFCKAKCTFCNFASDVFAGERMGDYVDRLCTELRGARHAAAGRGAILPECVDTIYLGGGTPSLLEPHDIHRLFATLREQFRVLPEAEVTLEAAPGQISAPSLEAAMRCGVNRVSLGVQSFVDRESAAVGRLHTGEDCHREVIRLRAAGLQRLSLDLIAGLPYQTDESWMWSVTQAIETGVDHASVYLLEIDPDSRLGRESIAGGSRYHAGALPPDDAVADWYLAACAALEAGGLPQYEISNFARPGSASRHNLKYWRREPYLGFGLDAHSMLRCAPSPGAPPSSDTADAIRWANPDDMLSYKENVHTGISTEPTPSLRIVPRQPTVLQPERIGPAEAFEEALFLGLRLTEGIDLRQIAEQFPAAPLEQALAALAEVEAAGLVERHNARVSLTGPGRAVSNEVFSRLLVA